MDSRTRTRRQFLSTSAAGLAGLLSGCLTRTGPERRRPNIIVMLADDLGYGDLGCYGCRDIRTPNLDRLARQGVRFTDAYANAPVCSPTRVAFVTGRYQQRLGHTYEDYIGAGSPGIDPRSCTTVGTYMRGAGYRTACFGKWNVGGETHFPLDHGFERWVGMDHNHNYYTHLGFNFAEDKWTGKLRMFVDRERRDIPGYTTDVFGDLAVDYVREADPQTPFFLYLAWQAPHSPLQPPGLPPDTDHASWPKGESAEMRGDYVQIVERMDQHIGRVLDTLEERGLARDTLVIFTSDNGGHRASRNAPLCGFKQDLYEGGIRVPMLMSWPGVIPAGTSCRQPAITLDITATLARVGRASVTPEAPLDGIDLLPVVTGTRPPDLNRTLFWRRRTIQQGGKIDTVRARAIRRGPWKYHEDCVRNRTFLVNLDQDPREEHNLLEARPELAAELKAALTAWEHEVTPHSEQRREP